MAVIFTGTIIGPHGETVGRWVRFEDFHNLEVENSRLRQAIMDSANKMVNEAGYGEMLIR